MSSWDKEAFTPPPKVPTRNGGRNLSKFPLGELLYLLSFLTEPKWGVTSMGADIPPPLTTPPKPYPAGMASHSYMMKHPSFQTSLSSISSTPFLSGHRKHWQMVGCSGILTWEFHVLFHSLSGEERGRERGREKVSIGSQPIWDDLL